MKLTKLLAATTAAIAMSVIADEADANLSSATAESWIPKISMSHSVAKGYYDRGILWDTNTGYEFSLDLNDLFIKNLSLSLYARLPIDKANYKDRAPSGKLDAIVINNPQYYYNGSTVYGNDIRDDEFDNFGLLLSYNYCIPDVKYLGDINLSLSYRLQKNADIYSEWKYKGRYRDHYFGSLTNGNVAYEYMDFRTNVKSYRRDDIQHDFSFGISLDNMPIVAQYLIPNMSFNINQDSHYFFQLGVKNSLPCDFISEKLSFNNSLDFYYFGKDYLKYKYDSIPPQDHIPYVGVVYDENGENPFQGGPVLPYKERIHSRAGFKNAILRSSLDYAVNERVGLSVYAMCVQQLEDLTENDKVAYPSIHSFEFLYGAKLTYNF